MPPHVPVRMHHRTSRARHCRVCVPRSRSQRRHWAQANGRRRRARQPDHGGCVPYRPVASALGPAEGSSRVAFRGPQWALCGPQWVGDRLVDSRSANTGRRGAARFAGATPVAPALGRARPRVGLARAASAERSRQALRSAGPRHRGMGTRGARFGGMASRVCSLQASGHVQSRGCAKRSVLGWGRGCRGLGAMDPDSGPGTGSVPRAVAMGRKSEWSRRSRWRWPAIQWDPV